MGYTGAEISISDFSGGLASNIATTNHSLNQASDLDNVVVLVRGEGIRKKDGNTVFNSTAMNSGANVQGLAYFNSQAQAHDYLVAVCGSKIFASQDLSGTMSDVTGAVTVTAAANDIWTMVPFNDKLIAFGGPPTNPDAPWKYTGSGNASALGGSPPSAYGAFQCNNRVFAYRTAANPSRVAWSIVGNEADWTGTGSGSSDIWTSDNDTLTGHAILNNNIVLLFKENSVHQMVVTGLVSGAFPIYPLFDKVGAIGKGAVVTADGLVYFITPRGRMCITNGEKIFDEVELPSLPNIDDVWDGLNTSRLKYVQGIRSEGKDFDHIVWVVSSGSASTNDTAIIWDLSNRCWLKNSTGYKANVLALTQARVLYGGFYNGKIYKLADSTTTTDASESTTTITSYWTSGWMTQNSLEKIQQPRKINVSLKTQTTGTTEVAYGFDFNSFAQTFTISDISPGGVWDNALWDNASWGGQTDLIRNGTRLVGRGNVFQYRLRNADTVAWKINSLTISGKQYGQKLITAR